MVVTYRAIIVRTSMDHLLLMLIICGFAFLSLNVSRTTESTAYEFVLATSQLDITSISQRWSPKLPSGVHKVKSVTKAPTAVGRKEPPTSSHNIGGARSLRFHEEKVEAIVQAPASASSEGMFTGMLAPDGSISSIKLMMEEGRRFADYDPINTRRRRSERHWNHNRTAGTQQRDSSRPNVFDKKYPPCTEELRDLIPCLNATAGGHLYGRCPNFNRGFRSCVIPAPAFYARQFKWPASKNQVRGPNIPNVPLLRQHGAAWMRPEESGNTIYVGDGDPRFPNGTIDYVRDLAKMLQGVKFGRNIRLVLDIDGGAGSMAVALENLGVLALSIAGEDSADNGVQLVVERGYPALLQSLGTIRLPYPSQAFDLIHCAACAVQWEEKDRGLVLTRIRSFPGGVKLLEVDRILRAGGFFVWMDPSEGGENWHGMEDLTKNMCWRIVARRGGRFAVWQKPTNQTSYSTRTLSTPPMCNTSVSANSSWNVQLQPCLVGFPETGGASTYPWPNRLQLPPRRLQQAPAAGMEAAKAEAYTADLNYWAYILAFYVVDFGPIRASEIHNVLDMNAGYGGFAAAISMKIPSLQWWVLNVVPVDQPDRLPVLFDRGLLGVYHDWMSFQCMPLSLLGRRGSTMTLKIIYMVLQRWAYDYVLREDAREMISKVTYYLMNNNVTCRRGNRCDMSDIVQEMDRLLRPGGFAIIRDQEDVLLQVQIVARAMHWKATVVDTESGPKGKDKVLNCQKTFWQPRIGKNGKG